MKTIEKTVLLLLFLLLCSAFSRFPVVLAEEPMVEETGDWTFPADGIISDVFSSRNGTHKGLDIAGDHDAPVLAVASGIVTKAYTSPTYGNVVMIRHANDYETVYAHLHTLELQEGMDVAKGEKVGTMGSTGQSTGTHLHFEIHQGGWTIEKDNAIDPFLVFGTREIGYGVASMEPAIGGAIETAGAVLSDPLQADAYEESTLYKASSIYGYLETEKRQPMQKELTYIVQNGDTLWSIARHYQISLETLQSVNNLESDLILVSQELSIPASPN